jgi:translation initiation factor 2 subunit 1
VHSIVKNTSDKAGISMQSLYEQVAWPLYAEYGHAYDAFQMAVACECPLTPGPPT